MIGLPTVFWQIVLVLIIVGHYATVLVSLIGGQRWRPTLAAVLGLAFVWMLLECGRLNESQLIEWYFVLTGLAVNLVLPVSELRKLGHPGGMEKETDPPL